jgi:hypothetical protein
MRVQRRGEVDLMRGEIVQYLWQPNFAISRTADLARRRNWPPNKLWSGDADGPTTASGHCGC